MPSPEFGGPPHPDDVLSVVTPEQEAERAQEVQREREVASFDARTKLEEKRSKLQELKAEANPGSSTMDILSDEIDFLERKVKLAERLVDIKHEAHNCSDEGIHTAREEALERVRALESELAQREAKRNITHSEDRPVGFASDMRTVQFLLMEANERFKIFTQEGQRRGLRGMNM